MSKFTIIILDEDENSEWGPCEPNIYTAHVEAGTSYEAKAKGRAAAAEAWSLDDHSDDLPVVGCFDGHLTSY